MADDNNIVGEVCKYTDELFPGINLETLHKCFGVYNESHQQLVEGPSATAKRKEATERMEKIILRTQEKMTVIYNEERKIDNKQQAFKKIKR